ncbi:MAG: SUF system Fe-S cluster assembly protein [Rhodospirillales bacterium]
MSTFGSSPMAGFGAPPGMEESMEFTARRGDPLPEGTPVATEEVVIEAMRTVYDPEIPVNIYDLGLIYTLDIESDGSIVVEMSLTAPGCPVAGEMPGMVADAVSGAEGTGEVEVRLVWDPPWSPALMSEDARLALGI